MKKLIKIVCIPLLLNITTPIFAMDSKSVRITTADDKEIKILKSHLQESNYFKNLLTDIPGTEQITMPNHHSTTVRLLKQALEKLFSMNSKNPLFLKQFIQHLPTKKLHDLIQLANYLDIPIIYNQAHTTLINHSVNPNNLRKLKKNEDPLLPYRFIKDIEYPAVESILKKIVSYLITEHIKNLNNTNTTLLTSNKQFFSLALNKNGTWLAAGSGDRHIYLFNVRNNYGFRLPCSNTVQCVSFSPKAEYLLASGGPDNLVRLWDINKKQCTHTLEGHNSTILFLTFSPDGAQLASSDSKGTIRIWNVQNKKCVHVLEVHKRMAPYPLNNVEKTCNVWKTCFVKNDQLLSASDDGRIISWDVKTGKKIKTISEPIALEEGYYQVKPAFGELAINPSKSLIAIDTPASPKARIPIINLKNNRVIKELGSHDGIIYDLQFYNDAILLSASRDKTICFWHVPSGTCLKALLDHTKTVRPIRLSHDKSHLYSGSEDGTIRSWNIMPTQLLHMLQKYTSLSFARLVYLAYTLKIKNKSLNLAKHPHLQKLFNTYDTYNVTKKEHRALQDFLCKHLQIINNKQKNQYTIPKSTQKKIC